MLNKTQGLWQNIKRPTQDVICIYYDGEWASKQKLLKHWHKGCDIKTSFYPNLSKRVKLLMNPNFNSTQETKKLKYMFVNKKSTSRLLIKSQAKIDE
jgi:hypothetical protein